MHYLISTDTRQTVYGATKTSHRCLLALSNEHVVTQAIVSGDGLVLSAKRYKAAFSARYRFADACLELRPKKYYRSICRRNGRIREDIHQKRASKGSMLRSIWMTLFLLLLFTKPEAQSSRNFTVHNNSKHAAKGVMAVHLDSLPALVPTDTYKVVDAQQRSQTAQWLVAEKQVLLWVQLPAGGSQEFFIVPGVSYATPSKVYGRAVPERYDDFAWENDRIAYRMYGAALEKTKENAFGIDVWSKRTKSLVINRWYQNGDYHTDKGEGLDFYKVGFTLGAGDVAPFIDDSIWFSKNYVRSRIIHSGPLRFCVELYYDAWKVNDVVITATKRITLDAGAQLNKMELTYQLQGADQMPVAIGIVRRKEGGDIWLNPQKGIMAYWEPEQKPNGNLGIAVTTTKPAQLLATNQHLLAVDTIKHNQTLTYFFWCGLEQRRKNYFCFAMV